MRGSLGLKTSRMDVPETLAIKERDALAGSAMRKHGRTFFLASLLLGERRGPVEALYRLCRHIDDIADGDANDDDNIGDNKNDDDGFVAVDNPEADHDRKDPAARLRALDRALRREDTRVAFVRIALRLRDAHGLPLVGLHRLIDEARRESDFQRPNDADALWRYAFGVAGVVGWMLRPMLGVRDPAAASAAVALGIAMQATNIARDVIEDAAIGRVYLPRDWAPSVDVAGLLRRDAAAWAEAHAATARLLAAAEGFYALAERGMPAILPQPRFAIRAAARMYRDIGRLTLERGVTGMGTRAVVPGARKAALLTSVAVGFPPRFGAPALDELPQALRDEMSALERL